MSSVNPKRNVFTNVAASKICSDQESCASRPAFRASVSGPLIGLSWLSRLKRQLSGHTTYSPTSPAEMINLPLFPFRGIAQFQFYSVFRKLSLDSDIQSISFNPQMLAFKGIF